MKYINPQITKTLIADKAIQGIAKLGMFTDASGQHTPNPPGYRADE